MKIAKESIPFISVNIILLLIFVVLNNIFLTIILSIILCFLLFFFRDPNRIINTEKNSFLSAADGKIVEIKEVIIDNQKYTKISVFMSIFNVHINRAPLDGIVEKIQYKPGKFISANKNLQTEIRERNEVKIKMVDNFYFIHQIAGVVARRVVFYPAVGDKITQGQKIGLIKFSSRVEHYIPDNFTICVSINEKTKGGVTTLAKRIN